MSDKDENNKRASLLCTDGGRENARDVLQDFWQATLDLNSFLSRAQTHQEHDVTVPTITLKALLDGVEAIKKTQSTQERRSVASLYIGTILGALIGLIGNFFASFWFQAQSPWNILGLVISSVLLLLTCTALFLQAKKYLE